MSFYFSLAAPYVWAGTNKAGKVLAAGSVDDLYSIPIPPGKDKMIGVVPGEDVVIHKVVVPARNRAKAVAAVPYALEDVLAEDVDKLHFAILDWAPGREAVVAVTAKEKMQSWLDTAATIGCDLDMILPDYLLVPLHPQASITVARKPTGTLVVRESKWEGLVLDEGTLAIWWRSNNNPDIPVAVADA